MDIRAFYLPTIFGKRSPPKPEQPIPTERMLTMWSAETWLRQQERIDAAREFVGLWEFLAGSFPDPYSPAAKQAALCDPRLKAARQRYLLACSERTIDPALPRANEG